MALTEQPIERLPREGWSSDLDALVAEAGWNQIEADWRLYLDHGSVYAVRDAGRIVASAATLPYGERFAWISMVLVSATQRRRGLGTRLLQRCIDELAALDRVPMLDATPAGRAVYLGLGFRDLWPFTRWSGIPAPNPAVRARLPRGSELRPIEPADLPAVVAYDAGTFGAERGALMASLLDRSRGTAFLAIERETIVGMVLGRNGRAARHIGPLIADSETTAQALLIAALDPGQGPVLIDIADTKTALAGIVSVRGLAPQRPFTRMRLGEGMGFDDSRRTFAVVGAEFG